MATVIDLLRHLGQHRAPDGTNALAGPIVLPGIADGALALPLPPLLIREWQQATARQTVGHHALALSTQQAGHDVALMGHGRAPDRDLLLLTFGQLRPNETSLWIMPRRDEQARSILTHLATRLGVTWIDAGTAGTRIAPAHLVLATPDDLHGRVLRFHDRAWRWLWPRLQCVAVAQLDAAAGIAGAHLHWLLRRVERLAAAAPLQFLTALTPVADVESSLKRMFDRPVRVIAAPDGPAFDTLIALWRCGHEREAALFELASQLKARKLAITVYGRTDAETARLRTAAVERLGEIDPHARVALIAGVPASAAERQNLLRLGYRLIIFLAGTEPHEQLIAAQAPLLLQSLPHWPFAGNNPYVGSEELACAAAERPIELGEVDRWRVRELRDRLIKKRVLQALPGGELWQSAPNAPEPHRKLEIAAIGGNVFTVLDDAEQPLERISATRAERVGLVNARWAPGWRVAGRDDEQHTIRLVPDDRERDTIVLADMTVAVREELAARSMHINRQAVGLTRGKVVVAQRIVGLRELLPPGRVIDRRVPSADDTQWSAAACWLGLPELPVDERTAGWSLQQALPFIALTQPHHIVPCYDPAQRRLYLIEAEPGGEGLIDGLYDRFERWLELAWELAAACIDHPLYQPIAAHEHRWIEALRRTAAAAEPPAQSTASSASRPEPSIDQVEARTADAPTTPPKPEPGARVYPAPPHGATAPPPVEHPRVISFPKLGEQRPDEAAASSRIVEAAANDRRATPTLAARREDSPIKPATFKPRERPVESEAVPSDPWTQQNAPEHEEAVQAEPPDEAAAASITEEAEAPSAFKPHDHGSALDELADQDEIQSPPAEPPDRSTAAADEPPAGRSWPTRQYAFDELLPPLPEEQDEQPEDDRDTDDPPAPLTKFEPPDSGVDQRRARDYGETRRQRASQRPRQPEPRRPQHQPRPTRWERPSSTRSTERSDRAGPGARPVPPRNKPTGPTSAPRAFQSSDRPQPDRPQPRREASEPAAQVPEPAEPQADVGAMIARMRQLRQQREAEQRQPPAPAAPRTASQPAELRFHIGERVQCLPYGTGLVRASKLVEGRELVLIDFPDYGEIEVDPAVSLLRRIDDSSGSRAGADDDIA